MEKKDQKDKKPSKKTIVKINMKGPITILGCSGQGGCREFVFEGEIDGEHLKAEVVEKHDQD